mmetsp:Transcript_67922/g.203086  ORF Transcript_67922/g.203086 Transcript_67922/m.203086 type:complete len:206 (-) Transcript_67922:12-629(-)
MRQRFDSHACSRALAGRGERASPPREAKRKARTSNGFFDNCTGDDDPGPDKVGAGSDAVTLEIAKWKVLPAETVGKYKDVDGLVDEFALLFSLRKQFPLHFLLLRGLRLTCHTKQTLSRLFSLSGRLSSDNTHTSPGGLSTYVRINKNRAVYDPTRDETFKAYRQTFGQVHACTRRHTQGERVVPTHSRREGPRTQRHRLHRIDR